MKKLIFSHLLLAAIVFTSWNPTLKKETIFIVKTKKGQTIEVHNLFYQLDSYLDLSSKEEFTVHVPYGSFKVRKDLGDIASLEVLDEWGNDLALTNTLGERMEATRSSYLYKSPSDRITGQSGKIQISLPLREIVSITRKGDDVWNKETETQVSFH